MNRLLNRLRQGCHFTGDISVDAPAFLNHHRRPKTAEHSAAVARETVRIAGLFGVDEAQAAAAGWLHDISAAFAPADRLEAARRFGLTVLPEEEGFPLILHQKLSVVLARELFGETRGVVLAAIGCHTTLRRDATPLDKVLFVADKIAWDQADAAPYLAEITAALDQSLDAAVLVYLNWMWAQRSTLRVVHPWLRAAFSQLASREW